MNMVFIGLLEVWDFARKQGWRAEDWSMLITGDLVEIFWKHDR